MTHLRRYAQPSPFDVALLRLMDQSSQALHLGHFDSSGTGLKEGQKPEKGERIWSRGVHGKGVCRPDGSSQAPGMGSCVPWSGQPETICHI